MKELQFWQQKLIQLTHDPVHKATYLGSGLKHTAPVKALFEQLAQVPWKFSSRPPDHAASGADRPVFRSGVSVDWRRNPIVTHPLQPAAQLRSPNAGDFHGAGSQARLRAVTTQITEWWSQQLKFKDAESSPAQEEHTPHPSAEPVWNDAQQLKRLCLRVWRGTSDAARHAQLFGGLLPADTRVPDHSLYDHVRVASALAFLPSSNRKSPAPEREPVLARFQVHGVQDFIRRSRKTRDLWTACMIYGELVWAAMEVIVEHYGPEAILYPDLLGNPYMDQWLLNQGLGAALPPEIRGRGAATSCVPIPNTFGVLVPRGGGEAGHLLPVAELMRKSEERVRRRWRSLADETSEHLVARLGAPDSWREQFDDQIKQRTPRTSWTVVAWQHRMKDLPTRPEGLRALPAIPDEASDELPELLQRRRAALEAYINRQVWNQYEHMRHVFWGENVDYLKSERGFDYPLVHRQLLMMHEATKTDERPLPSREQGAVCMLTGTEAALGGAAAGAATMHGVRRSADSLWRRVTNRSGDVERLGGPGAMKRYLAQVGRETASNGLIERWNGVGRDRPTKENITAPFPSTAGIAAAPFLEFVCEHAGALRAPIEAFVDAVAAAGQRGLLEDDSQHLKALPRLAKYLHDPLVQRFIKTEPQYLSYDAMAARIRRQREADPPSVEAERTLEAVLTCAKELRRAARALDQRTTMQEQYAIVAVDVDGLSKLISGDPSAVSTTWEDILHPDIVSSEHVEKLSTEWRGLLKCKRGVGPSLHAMVTRALADFTDDLVPWVVEREFHGRVIYAGGDDALFMAPAHEAIAIAARLQQLLSAPWVVDTCPERSLDRSAVERFRIPDVNQDPPGTPVSLDEPQTRWEPAVTLDGMTEQNDAPTLEKCRIFPMLGRAMTLSAGIAFGHFKTPLQMVLDAALENQATTKTRKIRGFTISRFTSSGNKVTFSAPWTLGEKDTRSRSTRPPPAAWSALYEVISAIKDGTMSARTPFELRETIGMVAGAHLVQSDGEGLEKARKSLELLLRGVAVTAIQISDARVNCEHLKPTLAEIVRDVLVAGAGDPLGNANDYANAAISGLLIARYFAGGAIDG